MLKGVVFCSLMLGQKGKSIIMKRDIPILFNRKEECCGCTACYAICPKEAISMIEDDEGFEYPEINNDICIRCFKCLQVCPLKNIE